MAQSDIDPQSPTAMIMKYLARQGVGPTSDNVRAALEQQARDPNTIAGLRADYAPPDKDGSSVAGKIEGSGGGPAGSGQGKPTPPPPPADLTHVAGADEVGWQPGSPNTSAQPSSGMDLTGLGQAILGGLGAGGLGALGARYLNRGPTLGVNEPGVPAPGTPNATGGAAEGDRYLLTDQTTSASPMEAALQKATAPQAVPQLGSDVPDLSGVRPVAPQPGDVIGRPGLPPGVSNVDAVNAGRGMQGVTGSSMPTPGEGPIPLRPRVSVQEVPIPARPPIRNPYGRLLLR